MELFSHISYREHANGKKDDLINNNTARTLYLKIDDDVYANLMLGQIHHLLFGAAICNKQDTPSKRVAREICRSFTEVPYVFSVIGVDLWSDDETGVTKKKVFFQRMELDPLSGDNPRYIKARNYFCINQDMILITSQWKEEDILKGSRRPKKQLTLFSQGT